MDAGNLGSQRMFKGTIDCVQQLYKKEGIKVFYKGYLAHILTGISGTVILLLLNRINSKSTLEFE